MSALKLISPWQFALFRVALGVYLVQHFALLVPWGSELWSREGVLADAALNPTHGLLPNPLEHWDAPAFVRGFLIALLVLSIAFTLGLYRRLAALLLWYGWACLFNRNNLISNPGIPYVGLILLLSVAVPPREALRVGRRRPAGEWFFPAWVFRTAWILLAVGYTFSGLDKALTSPSWRDGSAMHHLLHNPLARPGPLRDLALAAPAWMLRLATWTALAFEVSFLALCATRPTRLAAWAGVALMHLGILLVVAFADLTFGMLMVHLFTFDPSWFAPRPSRSGRHVVFIDGICVLCHRAAAFLIDEDRGGVLSFASLQGETFAAVAARDARVRDLPPVGSIVYGRDFGTEHARVFVRSEAVVRILCDIGGFWRVVSWARVCPRFVRDRLYDWVAGRRYRWFGKLEACRVPAAADRGRSLP